MPCQSSGHLNGQELTDLIDADDESIDQATQENGQKDSTKGDCRISKKNELSKELTQENIQYSRNDTCCEYLASPEAVENTEK